MWQEDLTYSNLLLIEMICSQCKKEIPEASKFCPYCGIKIDSAKTKSGKPYANKNNISEGAIFKNIMIVFLIVYFLIVVLRWIFIML